MQSLHVPGSQIRNPFANFAATLILVLTLIGSAFTQNAMQLRVSSSDRAAVAGSSHFWYHARAARTATAQSAPRTLFTATRPKMTGISAAAATAVPNLPPPGVYPDDLTYFGGPVVKSLASHNLFVNCTNSCWGNPNFFLTDLGKSNF